MVPTQFAPAGPVLRSVARRLRIPATLSMPPAVTAALPLMVVLTRVAFAPNGPLRRPPPVAAGPVRPLPLIVLLVTVSTARFAMPPPRLLAPVGELPLIVLV